MKKRKTNLIKLGILLFGVVGFLWNCEKDDFNLQQEIQQKNKASRISFKDFESNINLNTIYNKLLPHFKTNDTYQSKNVDSLNSTILIDDIVKMELENYSTYTFKIETESEDNQFYNLVLFVNNSQEIYDSKILKYTSSQEWVNNQTEHFTGTVNISNNDFFNVNNLLQSRSSGNCVTGVHGAWECSFGNLHAPGTCNGTSFVFTITLEYGPCSNSNENNYVDSPSGGGGGGGGGSSSSGDGDNEISTTPLEDPRCPNGKVKVGEVCVCPPHTNKIEDSNGNCVCPRGKVENYLGICLDKCEITIADLESAFPNTSQSTLQDIADAINTHGKDFGIDTDEKLQHFISQAAHEATNPINGIEFDTFEENLNYRWAKLGTKGYWDKYFNPITNPTGNPNKENPNDYKRDSTSNFVNTTKFANYVYDDANRDPKYKMGNTFPGDGYRYRGRGIFQLTGRTNYKKFNAFFVNRYNSSLNFINNPELLATNTKLAVISALWYYSTRVNPNAINTSSTVEQVTYKINGGTKGLSRRKQLFNQVKNHVNCK